MAEFKFFNIGKANAEITRLETELAGVRAELATAKENATAIEASAEGAQAELTQAKADLVTAKASIASLNGTITAKDTELAGVKAELKTANEKIAAPAGTIQQAAAVKAAEITAAQGQPPVKVTPPESPAGNKEASGLKGFEKVQAAIKAQINPVKAG